jgi:membrane protein DedA with SNARE-associated domain
MRENVIVQVLDREAQHYTGRALLVVVPILAVIAVAYVWWYRRRASQIKRSEQEAGRREGEAR